MLKLFVPLLIFLLQIQAQALDKIKISNGRYVAVENNILDKNKPVFVFLPGIYRGLDQRDEFIKMAKQQKINFISLHFSLHPESLLQIPENETPFIIANKINSADLANEVKSVIKSYKLNQPIIVGLSYSSSVTTQLAATGEFPLIVETAPMIQFDESDPSGAQVTQFWKNYFAFIPIYGAIWKEFYLQQIYQQFWSNEVDNLLKNYPQYEQANLKSLMVKSYAALSMAVDGFDFMDQDFSATSKRYFILGENEEPSRLELQKQAINLYQKKTDDTKSVIILPSAGHIIPADAPETYLKVLTKLSKATFKLFSGK